MIRNREIFETFERNLIRNSRLDIDQNFRIADALYEEAAQLGALPLKDPLTGLDTIVHLAKVVNSVPGTPR